MRRRSVLLRCVPRHATQVTNSAPQFHLSGIPAYIQEKAMKVQFLFASVAVCAASALLLAGSASAQWSSGTKVSNVIEGSGFPAGVSAARCGNGVVVGFGDTEANTPGSDVGFA